MMREGEKKHDENSTPGPTQPSSAERRYEGRGGGSVSFLDHQRGFESWWTGSLRVEVHKLACALRRPGVKTT